MELLLNLVWFTLAALMVWLWLKRAPASATSCRMQLVALGLVILIMLPVISVTDDLIAAQNPAEIDTCLRRDHDWLAAHAVVRVAIARIIPIFTEFSARTLQWCASDTLAAPAPSTPALSPIDNRPPPSA